jgi:hypothetical protein
LFVNNCEQYPRPEYLRGDEFVDVSRSQFFVANLIRAFDRPPLAGVDPRFNISLETFTAMCWIMLALARGLQSRELLWRDFFSVTNTVICAMLVDQREIPVHPVSFSTSSTSRTARTSQQAPSSLAFARHNSYQPMRIVGIPSESILASAP